ncbi:MAG: segregation/condensation protein A [Candidatus Omnitrophica bacterium]|nr:segregation/condensation protein A [Candidatus Omnitrophota bacterium]
MTEQESNSPEKEEIQSNEEETVESRISYQVSQDAYQGPLEKLLSLVREHDLDIFQVSLAVIAEDFLDYVKGLETPDLEEVGEYLVIASNLMVLKSRQLLPSDTLEEEEIEIDEQALLLERLKDYEKFKEAANMLREAEEKRRQLYVREKTPPGVGEREVVEFYEVNIFDLATAFQKVLKEIGDTAPPAIQGEEYTIDEKMAELQILLQEKGEMCLSLYLQTLESRIEIIVTFLALLELMRLLRIRAKQEAAFGDIWIYKLGDLEIEEDGDYKIAVATDEEGFIGVRSDDEDESNEDERDEGDEDWDDDDDWDDEDEDLDEDDEEDDEDDRIES